MGTTDDTTLEGACTCGSVRYQLTSKPMFVHCCHCRWCQRETGSAFVINALIEAERVVLLAGSPELVLTPSSSGRGQKISRCPTCHVALWSNYAGAGDLVRFVRVGIFLGQGIGKIRIYQEVFPLPLNQKSALPQPPEVKGSVVQLCFLDVFKKCHIF